MESYDCVLGTIRHPAGLSSPSYLAVGQALSKCTEHSIPMYVVDGNLDGNNEMDISIHQPALLMSITTYRNLLGDSIDNTEYR